MIHVSILLPLMHIVLFIIGPPLPVLKPAAAIYAVLLMISFNSDITIYTDSQVAICNIISCFIHKFFNICLYYKQKNFEFWSAIKYLIRLKSLTVHPKKVNAHSGIYWNDFADNLANTTHSADSTIHLTQLERTYLFS